VLAGTRGQNGEKTHSQEHAGCWPEDVMVQDETDYGRVGMVSI
jgi:hypothetical protein